MFSEQQRKGDPVDYYKRQTGRTHRMIEDAIATAKQGHAVVVLFKDEMSAGRWREKVGVVTGLSIEPMKVKMPELDWKELRLIGARGNHKLFIDHDVLYVYHKELFKAFTRYDSLISAVVESFHKEVVVN